MSSSVLDFKDIFIFIWKILTSSICLTLNWKIPKQDFVKCILGLYCFRVFRDKFHLLFMSLAQDLRGLELKNKEILQYVDDLLICSLIKKSYDTNTLS